MHVSSEDLNLEGRQPSLLRTYWRAIRYLLEAYSSSFSATFQMRSQVQHTQPSIAAIPVCCPAFSDHFRNLGTTTFCDPLTCDRTSLYPFQFHNLFVHRQWSDQDHQQVHHVSLLHPPLQHPPWKYLHTQGNHDSCHPPPLLRCLPL